MAAIVTTLRLPHDKLDPVYSFVDYHLAVGFKHIYLFVDLEKDEDSTLLLFDNLEQYVSVFYSSSVLRETQKISCQLYSELENFLDNEVQSRQMLNAEYTAILATKAGYNWLLHIDIDEIFYCTEGKSVTDHFLYLDSLNVLTMTYINHEGVPESYDTDDYFTSITLFRKHHFALPLTRDSEECIKYWRSRRKHNQYLLAYDNGKSAVRLGYGKALPINVHKWKIIEEVIIEEEEKKDMKKNTHQRNNSGIRNLPSSRTAIADARNLCYDSYLPITSPCILHYVTCGMSWLTMKYEILGKFSDFWYKGKVPIAPCFHLDARDAYWQDQNQLNCDGQLHDPSCSDNNTIRLYPETDMHFDCATTATTIIKTEATDCNSNSNISSQSHISSNLTSFSDELPPPSLELDQINAISQQEISSVPQVPFRQTTMTISYGSKREEEVEELALRRLYLEEVMFPGCECPCPSSSSSIIIANIKTELSSSTDTNDIDLNRQSNISNTSSSNSAGVSSVSNNSCHRCLLLHKQLTTGVLFRSTLVSQIIHNFRNSNNKYSISNDNKKKPATFSPPARITSNTSLLPSHNLPSSATFPLPYDDINNVQSNLPPHEVVNNHSDIKVLNIEKSKPDWSHMQKEEKTGCTIKISSQKYFNSHNLEEMDKLRLISQAAVNFL